MLPRRHLTNAGKNGQFRRYPDGISAIWLTAGPYPAGGVVVAAAQGRKRHHPYGRAKPRRVLLTGSARVDLSNAYEPWSR